MRRITLRRLALVALLQTLVTGCSAAQKAKQEHTSAERAQGLRSFFQSLDTDRDGQIEPDEARRFIGEGIGGPEFDTDKEVSEALKLSLENIDGEDAGQNLSEEEFAAKQKWLTAERVEDWVRYSVRLPKYADSFRENSISGEDFFLMVSPGSRILQDDLGVLSKLHREQFVRAMKKIIMRAGKLPAPPRNVSVRAAKCGEIEVRWDPAPEEGVPEGSQVHLFVVERTEAGKQKWRPAPLEPASPADDTVWEDRRAEAGRRYLYRVVAWNGLGASDPSEPSAEVKAPPECVWKKVWSREAAALFAGLGGAAYLFGPKGGRKSGRSRHGKDRKTRTLSSASLELSADTAAAAAATDESSDKATGGGEMPRRAISADPSVTVSAAGAGRSASAVPSGAVAAGGVEAGGEEHGSPGIRAGGGAAGPAQRPASNPAADGRASSSSAGSSRELRPCNSVPQTKQTLVAMGRKPVGHTLASVGEGTGGEGSASGESGSGRLRRPSPPELLANGVNRDRCNVKDCTVKFGAGASMKFLLTGNQRHFCGRCGHVFCPAHTACSDHWEKSACRLVSVCRCIRCDYEYETVNPAEWARQHRAQQSRPDKGTDPQYLWYEKKMARASSSPMA